MLLLKNKKSKKLQKLLKQALFLAEGEKKNSLSQSPLQEREDGPRSGPYLQVFV